MADYDVGVLGLSSPPPSAVLTPYRPAVSVRNNGLHAALASGYVRIYSAGLLIFESEVFSGTLAPGATGTADALEYWTPPAEGTYIVQGYVSTPLDQVEPNNNLNPTTIFVVGGPVPPTPTVPLHAAQHEEGGVDPINVDGLPGVLADPQPAQAHGTQHQAGQGDVLNVSGLAGILGDPQTPVAHGNAHHSPVMSTAAELSAHSGSSAAHSAATNLANREISGPEVGLVKSAQLSVTTEVADPGDNTAKAALRFDRKWGPANAVHHAAKHAIGGLDEVDVASVTTGIEQAKTCTPSGGQITIVTAELTAAQAKAGTVINFTLIGSATTAAGIGQSVDFTIFHQNGGASTAILTGSIPLAANKSWTFHLFASVGIGTGRAVAGAMYAEMSDTGSVGTEVHADAGAAIGFIAPAAASRFFAAVAWVGGSLGSSLSVSNAIASGVALP
jgi:hypothetical protein